MPEPTLTPSLLWKQMTAEQRLAAAHAFWSDEDAVDDQVQAALLIAQRKKFRPKTVIGLDLDRKSRHLASMPSLPDGVAGRALVLYHLADQRPMMGAFLDALGITHDNGLINEDDVKPDAAKVPAAASQLRTQFPEAEVRLYLNTLLCQAPETWGALRGVPELA